MKNENIEKLKERFLKDVDNHTMAVITDGGVNRHLRFSNNSSSIYMFGLVTWPGYLCIYGDMGTSVFARTNDMFGFFGNEKGELRINPSYWHEKLESISRHGGNLEFCEESFRDTIKEEFDTYVEDRELEKEDSDTLWQELEDEVLCNACESEETVMRSAMEFKSSPLSNGDRFEFQDFWEHSFKEYTHHFIWQLYAIVWGINMFNKSQEQSITIRS